MALASLRPTLVEVETTLQWCADRLMEVRCEGWPELAAVAHSLDLALFVLERTITEMGGQP